MSLVLLSLLFSANAQDFGDAFEEEDDSSAENIDARSEDLQLILQLEACKETPKTAECQDFFIQHGEDLGVDLEKYVITQPKVKGANPTPQDDTSSLFVEDIDSKTPSQNESQSDEPVQTSNENRKIGIHLSTGISTGPFHREYYGRIAKSNIDLSPTDLYAWETLQVGNSLKVRLGVSYAISDAMRVGIGYQVRTGEQELDVHSFVIGQFSAVPPSSTYPLGSSSWSLFGRWTQPITDKINGIAQLDIERLKVASSNFYFGDEPYPTFGDTTGTLLTASPKISLRPFGAIALEPGLEVGYLIQDDGGLSVLQQNGGVLSVNLDEGDVAKVDPPDSFSRWMYGFNIGITY